MNNMNNHVINYFHQISLVSDKVDKNQIEKLAKILTKIRNKQEATFSNLKEATDYILKQERLKNA